jgi:hypothetical protein
MSAEAQALRAQEVNSSAERLPVFGDVLEDQAAHYRQRDGMFRAVL